METDAACQWEEHVNRTCCCLLKQQQQQYGPASSLLGAQAGSQYTPQLVLLYSLVAVSGGLVAGLYMYAAEALCTRSFVWLEKRGVVRRLAPTAPLNLSHALRNIFNTTVSYLPVWFLVGRYWLGDMGDRMVLDFNPLRVWLFVWVGMFLHDAWFFAMHNIVHGHKAIFRIVHAGHHDMKADLTANGTTYGDGEPVDLFLHIGLFHGLVLLWMYLQPTWNPLAFLLLLVFEVNTDVTGHCGYWLPDWLHGLISGGVGLTPVIAARPSDHYIHHLDPRYNRSLYFRHWDWLTGTQRGHHRLFAVEKKTNSAATAPHCNEVQRKAVPDGVKKGA
eukprot:jgi/Chlat1/2536/Chrsp175S02388